MKHEFQISLHHHCFFIDLNHQSNCIFECFIDKRIIFLGNVVINEIITREREIEDHSLFNLFIIKWSWCQIDKWAKIVYKKIINFFDMIFWYLRLNEIYNDIRIYKNRSMIQTTSLLQITFFKIELNIKNRNRDDDINETMIEILFK